MRETLFISALLVLTFLGVLGFVRPHSHRALAKGRGALWLILGGVVMAILSWDGYQSAHADTAIWRFGFAEALALTIGLSMALMPVLIREESVVSFFSPFWSLMAMVALFVVYLHPSAHLFSLTGFSSESHWLFSMLAHAMFTLWALLTVLYTVQSSRLHHPVDVGQLRQLPPLMAIEKQALWMGRLTLVFLSLALITGLVYSEHINGKMIERINHKLLLSSLAWVGVMVIVWGQYSRSWRGKLVNNAILLCYVFLILSYIGSRFVLEILLHRS